MATAEQLEYIIKVQDRELRELKKTMGGVNEAADKDLGKAAAAADSHTRKMGAGATIAAAAFGGALVVGLKKSVDAAIDSQKVQKATEVQLRALNISYGAHKKQIDSVINSTSRLAALDDEELQQSFTRLLPATHNVNKALGEMQLAADVARARNISLESATNLVVRANTGSAGALRRLGISLVATTAHTQAARAELATYKKTHDTLSPAMTRHFQQEIANAQAADKHAQAVKNIDTLQKTFAGSAKAYGEGAAGAQDRFKVALENVQEAIGGGLLPMLTRLINTGSEVLQWTTDHGQATKILLGVLAAGAGAFLVYAAATKAVTATTIIANGVQAIFRGELLATNAAMRANPIGIIITLLVALGVGLVLAYKKSETFREIVNGAFHAVKVVIEDTRRIAGELWHGFEATLDWVRGHWHTIALLISGPFAPLVALATNAFGIRSALVGAFEAVKTKASDVIGDIHDFFAGLPKRLAKPLDLIHDAIHTVVAVMGDLGKALDKVMDGFKWIINNAKRIGDLFGSIGHGISGLAGKLNPFGDGIAGLQHGFDAGGGGDFPIPPGARFDPQVNPGLYDDMALAMSLGLHESSGYRPGSITSTGNQSLHSVFPAKAVDMAGGEGAMRTFFLREIGRPGIRELIHSPYWWHPGSGVQFIPSSAGTVLKDHYSHVHVGIFDQGGVLPPGLTLALNMTGRPERVVAPHQEGPTGPLVYVQELHVHDDGDYDKKIGAAVNRALGVRTR